MHEHYKEYGLINMNGRLYDPIAGRMLSPDIYVQDPTNSQNYNRYSYVLNNPLKYTDPSGWMYKVEKTYKVDDPPINLDNFSSNYGGSGGGGFSYNFAGSYSMYASDPAMYAFMYGTQTWMQTATATAAVISTLSSAYAMLSKSGTGTQHIRGQNNVGNAGEQKIRSLSYTWTFGDKSSNAYISNYNNYTNAIAQVGGKNGTPYKNFVQSNGGGFNTDIVDNIVGAIGVNMGLKEGLIELAQKTANVGKSGEKYLSLTKAIGKVSGITGTGIAWYDYFNKPTTGGLVKAFSNTGLMIVRINPLIGVGIGIMDLTGGSDWIYNRVGNGIDNMIKP